MPILLSRVCLLVAAVCPLTFADELHAQQTGIPEEVIQKWKEFERFSHTIQGNKRVTVTSTEWPDKPRSYCDSYKQNRECVVYSGTMTDSSGVVPTKRWVLVNSRYKAEIMRNPLDPDKVLLKDYEPNPVAEPGGKRFSAIDFGFLGVAPHFGYQGKRLSQLVANELFKIKDISKISLDGRDLVQFDFSFEDKKYQFQSHGSLYLDPEQCWCIRRISDSYVRGLNGKPFFKVERNTEFQIIAHSSGFPLVKSQVEREQGYSGKKKFEGTAKTDYEWEINDHVPNSEFTLTAFGLPEPIDAPFEKPTPWYLWIMVAAAGCFAMALLFRYLRRRHQRRLA